jgi:hypothetical protein
MSPDGVSFNIIFVIPLIVGVTASQELAIPLPGNKIFAVNFGYPDLGNSFLRIYSLTGGIYHTYYGFTGCTDARVYLDGTKIIYGMEDSYNDVDLGVLVTDLNVFQYPVELNTYENATALPAGSYQGFYSFTNNTVGSPPAGWTTSGTTISSTIGTHSKVANVNGATGEMINTFAYKDSGSAEWWIRLSHLNESVSSHLGYVSGGWNIYMEWKTNGKLDCKDSSSWYTLLYYAADVWYHFRVNWSFSTHKWELWLDGVKKSPADGFDFYTNTGSGITVVAFNSYTAYQVYTDAVDYSWASGYYLNRNQHLDNYSYQTLFCKTGYYLSPILDLGVASNYYYTTLCCYASIPALAGLVFDMRFSTNLSVWTAFSSFSLNDTINAAHTRYIQFCLNFTSTTSQNDTPAFDLFILDWIETVLNEYPQLGDISIAFDNETLTATISTLLTDPDNDTMDIFLCLLLGDVVMNRTEVANGTIVEFNITCEYSTAYEYYLNVTDGEDSVQSSTFGFTTGAEPIIPPPLEAPTASIEDYLVLIVGVGAILLIGASNIGSRRRHS